MIEVGSTAASLGVSAHPRSAEDLSEIDILVDAIEALAGHALERTAFGSHDDNLPGYGRVYVDTPSESMKSVLYQRGWRWLPPSQRLPGYNHCMYADEPVRTPVSSPLSARVSAAQAFCDCARALNRDHGEFFTGPVVLVPLMSSKLTIIRDQLISAEPYDHLTVGIYPGWSREMLGEAIRADRIGQQDRVIRKPAWMIDRKIEEEVTRIMLHSSILDLHGTRCRP